MIDIIANVIRFRWVIAVGVWALVVGIVWLRGELKAEAEYDRGYTAALLDVEAAAIKKQQETALKQAKEAKKTEKKVKEIKRHASKPKSGDRPVSPVLRHQLERMQREAD